MNWIMDDLDKVDKAIVAARDYVKANDTALTVERVACCLGISTEMMRQIACGKYNGGKKVTDEVIETVKMVWQEAAASLAERGMSRPGMAGMPVFLLKNNYGYVDKVEHSGDVNHVIFIHGDKVPE